MKKQVVMSLALLTFVVGCAHHNVLVNTSNGNAINEDTPNISKTEHFLFWGWFQKNHVDAKSMCGNSKVKAVSTKATSGDRFLEILTIGLYSPRTVSVWCEK